METWIINVAVVFLLCMFLAGFMIPKILLISFRKNLFDGHDERKIHKGAVPRLGGLAFSPVIFFSIVLVIAINFVLGKGYLIAHLHENSIEMAFEFCAMLLLYVVGIADDLIGVRYSAKFYIQIISSILLVVGGIYIDNFHGMFGIYELPAWIGYILTVVVIVFFTNAINLIDGVDGLASGLSIAASLFYAFSFIYLGYYLYAAMAFATLGVLLPFYYYNVFGNVDRGRKIFMGDTGALTLGFILSFLSIKLLMITDIDMSTAPNSFVLAFAPMLVPCFDVLRVFFRRIRNHKSPFLPDRTHIHHKLMAMGLSTRRTMVAVVGFSIFLTIVNIALSLYINVNIIFFANVLGWVSMNMWMSKAIHKKGVECDFNKKG